LDRDDAGNRLDGAGDLRRDLEAARELDLDLGAFVQQEDERDLAVRLLLSGTPVGRAFQPLRHSFERRLVAQEYPQALGKLGRRLIERLDHADARAHVVALQLGRQRQQDGGARLEQVAELLQPLREQHRLVLPGRIGEPDDAHLAAGARAPLGARHHRAGDTARARTGAHRARELGPGLYPHALEGGGIVVERVAGETEADRGERALQPLRRQPWFDRRQAERIAGGRTAERELQRAAFGRLELALRRRQDRIDRGKDARAITLERIERAGG